MSRESYYLSVGLQSSLAAYIVCAFFASIQYEWYLYYPVAYTVALRTIYKREKMEPTSETFTRAERTVWSHIAEGSLWRLDPLSREIAHVRSKSSVHGERS